MIRKLAQRFARADIVFYLLPFLMLNLVAGTIAQASLGLYESHRMFFSSFFYWLGPLPLPGGYTLTGLLTFSLLCKFLAHSEWRLRKFGIILAHLGTLVLLAGGLLTALTAREGFMVIAEGASTPYVYDYNAREFFIFRDNVLQHRLRFDELRGDTALANFPFTLYIKNTCRNCAIEKNEQADNNLRGMARFMKLADKAPEKENEANLSGVSFEIAGGTRAQNGAYIAFENMPAPIELEKNGRAYKLIFGKQQRLLPFNIALQDFVKDDYPGTQNARAYHSDIIVEDSGIAWPARIEMNKPLRYKNYTFFQSSFEQSPGAESTILSVVENRGRLFPYIATLLIVAGLLLHLTLNMRKTV